MKIVAEIIKEIEELPPDERLRIADYIYELDDDVGLEEDTREANKAYEEWKRTGEATPAEEVFKKLGV